MDKLAAVDTLLAVELRPPDTSLMTRRLSTSERLSDRYVRYLDRLFAALAATQPHGQIEEISLPAERHPDLNALAVLDLLSHHVAPTPRS